MKKHTETIAGALSSAWSCTSFGAPELSPYAAPVIAHETRRGVALLSLVALLFLALHIYLSSARVVQLRALYLLAMLLLIVVRLPGQCCPAFDTAYRLADELLYQAKHAGGNAMRCGVADTEGA